MSRKLCLFIAALILSSSTIAQEQETKTEKTGWNFGVLPALGYDSNLGMLLGGIVNMFDYGDGSRYPDFDHNLYLQLSAYTKGSMDAIMFFDSYSLIPKKHFIGRLSYNRNRAYPFHGFNGLETVYNPNFETFGSNDFISQVFYKLDRGLIKADFLLEDKIGDTKLNWIAGLDLGWYNTLKVDIDHLNRNKEGDDIIPNQKTLFELFNDWNIINANEMDGGFDNSLKFGLTFNSRDRLTNPMKGMWTEMLFRVSPKFIGNPANFARLSIVHRQYFTLVKEKLSFAYRLWYEGTFGDVPYYSRQHLTTSNYFEGFGGAQTVRGVLMNRVVGQHSAIGNFELRWKALRFNAIGQNFYVGLNAFADAGTVLKGYQIDKTNIPAPMLQSHFTDSSKGIYSTFGAGLKLVMNENFVVSADWAKSIDKNYGTSGMYILIGYLF
jgi:outer membrane protein assembly factor BamA